MRIKILCIFFVILWACPGVCRSITVIDQAGREVAITQPVERVVTTFMPATFFALCAGLQDKLVGASHKDASSAVFQALIEREHPPVFVGNRTNGLNLETISSLNPDLIILYGQKDGVRLAERLTALGYPAIVILPENFDAMEEALTLLGVACGREDHTASVVGAMQNIRSRLGHLFKNCERQRVYYASNRLLTTVSREMLQTEMITLAGGTNVSGDTTGFYINISTEQLLAWNPEVILLSDRIGPAEYTKLQASEFSDVAAVLSQSIIRVPTKSYWDFPSPLAMGGALWLSSKLHPDKLSEAEAQKEINAFYDVMFGPGFSARFPESVGMLEEKERGN